MGRGRNCTGIGIRLLSTCLVVASLVSCSADPGSQRAEIGGPAPDFTLSALSGQPMSLSGHKGKVVLVDFWATWCPPCVEELPHIQRLHEQFSAEGLVVMAITIDQDRNKVPPFVSRNGYTFSVLYNDGQTDSKYGVSGIPTLYLVDRQGKVRYHHVGYSEQSIRVIEKEIEALLEEDA